MNKRFGKNDFLLFAVFLMLAVVILVVYLFHQAPTASYAVITVDGRVYGMYELSDSQTIEIKEDGVVTNVVRIADGTVFMERADCPDQLCVKQGKKNHDQENIVCLPNKVVVTVYAEDEAAYDSIAN